ncbi:MAG: hypothetical protein H0W02_22660 [Ktedonobacteraceae bacterium]|nr:hypothetical protein [Ktedonobacteraceae bacterium]
MRYGAGYLIILVLAKDIHTSPSGIGAIFTAAGAGALLGSIASNWTRAKGSALIFGVWLVLLAIATTLNKRVRCASLPGTGSAI